MSINKVFLKTTEKKANELIDKFESKAADVVDEIESAIIKSAEYDRIQNMNHTLRYWDYIKKQIKDKTNEQIHNRKQNRFRRFFSNETNSVSDKSR